jgi:uncharacterized membrane protein
MPIPYSRISKRGATAYTLQPECGVVTSKRTLREHLVYKLQITGMLKFTVPVLGTIISKVLTVAKDSGAVSRYSGFSTTTFVLVS